MIALPGKGDLVLRAFLNSVKSLGTSNDVRGCANYVDWPGCYRTNQQSRWWWRHGERACKHNGGESSSRLGWLSFYIATRSRWRAQSTNARKACMTLSERLGTRPYRTLWQCLIVTLRRFLCQQKQRVIVFHLDVFSLSIHKIIQLENGWFLVKLLKHKITNDATSAKLLRQYRRGSQLHDVFHISADHERRRSLADRAN